MITYNNVTIVCVKCEKTVWGWGQVSAAWIGVARKVRETSGNFTLPGEWSPCAIVVMENSLAL